MTKPERTRWLICFWLLFLVTPISAALVAASSAWLSSLLPAWVSDLVPSFLRYLLTAGGFLFGTAYCLVRLVDDGAGPITRMEVFCQTLGCALLLFFFYGALALMAGVVLAAVSG